MVIIVSLLLLSFIIIGRRTRTPIDMEYEADAVLEAFIAENITSYDFCESFDVIVNFSRYEAGKSPEMLEEANVVAKAYTYMKKVGEENAYQTVIDIWYGSEYMISKGDICGLEVEDTIYPNGDVKGELWTRKKEENEWTYAKDIRPMWNGLQYMTILGTEISNREDASRILLCFSSSQGVEGNGTRYILNYSQVR